jgi:polyribonucleotide nucleotidyltransferase
MHILSRMNEAISTSRESVPANAPRIVTVQIDPERIGELIGPGGKIIRAIIERSGAEINVEDSGVVTIASVTKSSCDIALKMVEDLFKEVAAGEEFNGVVKRITDFGAFVELYPGKEGLLHISKISNTRVNSVRDVYSEGDRVDVVVLGVDRQGRVDLASKEFNIPVGMAESSERRHDRDRNGERRPRR